MSQDDTTRIQGATTLEELAAQGDMKAKRKLAGRLLFGYGVDKDEAKAVLLLEDCVANGDADAILMLAKWCALGHGMKRDAERAEALLSDAAKKGNNEACILMKLIDDWKGNQFIYCDCLQKYFLKWHKRRNSCCFRALQERIHD